MQWRVMVAGLHRRDRGLVAGRRAAARDVWRLMPVVLGAMGVAAVLVRASGGRGRGHRRRTALAVRPRQRARAVPRHAGLRLGSPRRWEPFRRDVVEKYREAAEVTLRTLAVLSLVIMVPAEELFWRGLFQARLGRSRCRGGGRRARVGRATSWRTSPSRSLPIVAGAVVGGALWAGLAWWSGGVLASLASHILWTGLMLALPPGAGRPRFRRVRARPGATVNGELPVDRGAAGAGRGAVLRRGRRRPRAARTARRWCSPTRGGRIWLTTSRGSVKARAWKVDPASPGLVRSGELSVTFTGTVKTYDALDRSTWGAAVAGATSIARATATLQQEERAILRRATPSTRARCRWRGRRRDGCSSASTSSGRRCSMRTACRRAAAAGAARPCSHATFRSHEAGRRTRSPRCPPTSRRALGRSGRGRRSRVAGARGPVVLPVAMARRTRRRSTPRCRPRRSRSPAPGPTRRWRSRSTRPASGVRATWWAPWCRATARSYVLDCARARARRPRARSRAGLHPERGRARAHRARAAGLVEGLVERERAGRDDDGRVLGRGRRAARAVWDGGERPRNLPHWDKHIVSVRPARGGHALGARYEVVMGVHGRASSTVARRGPGVGAAVARRGAPRGPARSDRHDLGRHRCRSSGACCATRSRTGSAGRSAGSAAASINAVGGAQLALRRGVLAQKAEIERRR